MEIDTVSIRRLRDELFRREDARASAIEEKTSNAHSAEVRAVMRRVEPFAETMYVMMLADGEPGAIERKALAGALHVLSDGCLGDFDIELLLNRFADNAAREGGEGCLSRIGARLGANREDRETAFTLAAVIALADARVDVSENQMLALVQEYFGLTVDAGYKGGPIWAVKIK